MLAREGKYDNTLFHRHIPGFMLQGGDPTGTGSGGQSYWGTDFRDEHSVRNAYKHDARGMLSMANRGKLAWSSDIGLLQHADSIIQVPTRIRPNFSLHSELRPT